MSSDSGSVSSSFSSGKEPSTSTDDVSSNTGTQSSREGHEILAAKETRLVKRSRSVVIIILIATASVAGFLTYHFLRRGEEQNFTLEVRADNVCTHERSPLLTALPSLP